MSLRPVATCSALACLLLAPRAAAQPSTRPAEPAATRPAKPAATRPTKPPAKPDAVKSMFRRARVLFEAGNHEGALVQLEKVYKLGRSWRVLIFLGITHARLFHYGKATTLLRRYLRQGGKAITAAERARVEAELGRLQANVAEVAVVVVGGPALIRANGERVGRSPLARPLLLGPRKYTITAERAGYALAQQKIAPHAGARLTITLTLVRSRALLRVESSPRGARITLDGRDVGTTPWEQSVVVARYRLRVTHAGYQAHHQWILLASSASRDVTVVLEPLPPKRWYQRWGVWAVIGAGVAATVVATSLAVWAATRPSYDVVFGRDADFSSVRGE